MGNSTRDRINNSFDRPLVCCSYLFALMIEFWRDVYSRPIVDRLH